MVCYFVAGSLSHPNIYAGSLSQIIIETSLQMFVVYSNKDHNLIDI